MLFEVDCCVTLGDCMAGLATGGESPAASFDMVEVAVAKFGRIRTRYCFRISASRFFKYSSYSFLSSGSFGVL
jgi:hypothetical protein